MSDLRCPQGHATMTPERCPVCAMPDVRGELERIANVAAHAGDTGELERDILEIHTRASILMHWLASS